ncbi:MAG: murein biosynthesis integral membrane protein MurJ [Gammaproteobacteria bacterium]|nr:murein biosynthesis integral membrane protein MurJ [Gammaproteobacteria bacterium]
MSRQLLRASLLFGSNTLLSRLLGFVRDMVLAQLFGADAGLDAFLVAFRIPNFMRRLFAEGAFSQAFIPTLSHYRQQQSHQQVRQLISEVSGALGLFLLLLSLVGILLAPLLIALFAPGFAIHHHSDQFPLAYQMLRITFPYILFISLTALAGAILNSYDQFGIPSFTPCLLNIALIAAALLLAPRLAVPVKALSWGLLIAGIAQLLFLLPFLQRKRLLILPRWNRHSAGVKEILYLMSPALFAASVTQVNLLLDTLFASFLPTGSLSWLYYSERLMMFPLGIIGVAISTVILPNLSRHVADKGLQRYSATLDWALRLLLLLGLPSTVGLLILAGPLLCTLFQYHAFNSHDVLMARQSLMAFALGLQAFMLIKVLSSAFYAHKNMKLPVKIALISTLLNILFNLLLIVPLKHGGIALATSLSGIINSALLLYQLKKHQLYQPSRGWYGYLLRLIIANGIMAIFLLFIGGNLQQWLQQDALWRIEHLAIAIVGAICLYLLILWLSGIRLGKLLSVNDQNG